MMNSASTDLVDGEASDHSPEQPRLEREELEAFTWSVAHELRAPLQVIEARVLTRVPDSFRRKQRTEWSDANKPGHEVDSFIEGPTFDRAGNLYIVDIAFGRISTGT